MGSMYLGTASVVSSWVGEPGISVKFDVLGVGVRQNKPVQSPPAGREQWIGVCSHLENGMPPFQLKLKSYL